jgi:membrane protease YdiL (CAAX protease family)
MDQQLKGSAAARARREGEQSPETGLFSASTRSRPVHPGWRILTFLAALAAVVLVVNVAWKSLGLPPQLVEGVLQPGPLAAAAALVFGAALFISRALLRRFENRPLSTLGIPLRGPWIPGLLVGSLLGLAPVGLIVAIAVVTGNAQISAGGTSTDHTASGVVVIALGIVLLSVLEEILWRGYLLQQLAQWGGRWLAALITAAAWASLHAMNPGASALGVVNTTLDGLLLAWLVMRTGSLWIVIGNHIAWNFGAAYLFGLRVSGLDLGRSLMTTTLDGPVWMTGGEYGFEGSILMALADVAVLGIALLLATRLPGHPRLLRFFEPASRPERRQSPAPAGRSSTGSE